MINYNGNFTDAMKGYCKEKLNKLSLVESDDVKVSYKTYSETYSVEISINNSIRATKEGYDFYKLVDNVVEKLMVQVERKNKYVKYINKEDSYTEPDISREKVLILDSMTYIEAIESMEALGHSFFVYKDVDTENTTSIVYKRNDGSYGVIICK